jgi:hypothetical protein
MGGYSYTQYADATTQSMGRLLYYLDHYCPLYVTETVTFELMGPRRESDGALLITWHGDRFAYVTWEDDGAPRFDFQGHYATYTMEQDRRREEAMKQEQEYTARRHPPKDR